MEHAKQQNEQETKQATGFDWELQQVLIHLRNAISLTNNQRAHLLHSAEVVIKGVRES